MTAKTEKMLKTKAVFTKLEDGGGYDDGLTGVQSLLVFQV